MDQSYLKIINHTVFLSGGMCIYPLSLRPNTGIWKICLTGVFNFIPKRIWLVKNSNNSKEEKFEPTGDLATLLAKGDIALSLGTAYEWDSGLYLDLRGILGFLGMLRTKIGEIQNYSQIEGERSRYEAYKRLGSKCEEENMKNYCFTLTIGYQLFKKFKNEDEDI
ncbi:hypothetical protein [Candidatus Cardinium hertigii]|uniref:hypothetical protein n=1 Tax=Candidatus Cardinium hertigii TaxID=247481 RepID=UPI000F4B70AF|nr:hypothetical protein [Candidatus Cardinium hertigii]